MPRRSVNRSAQRRVRWGVLAVLVVVGASIGLLVLWPNGWTINRLVVWLYFEGGVFRQGRWLPLDDPGRFDFSDLLNVIMMVPLAAGLLLAFPRLRPWLAAATVIGVSAAIELTQLLLIDGRMASWRDLATNSIGGLLGAALGWLVNRALARVAE